MARAPEQVMNRPMHRRHGAPWRAPSPLQPSWPVTPREIPRLAGSSSPPSLPALVARS